MICYKPNKYFSLRASVDAWLRSFTSDHKSNITAVGFHRDIHHKYCQTQHAYARLFYRSLRINCPVFHP